VQQLLVFQELLLAIITVKCEKVWFKQIAMNCFRYHRVMETLSALQRKTTEQSLCEENASVVGNCETYSSSQTSRRSQYASCGN